MLTSQCSASAFRRPAIDPQRNSSTTPPVEGESHAPYKASVTPQVIPPISPKRPSRNSSITPPVEGESQKPEPNGEGFCGGGFAQGEPRARSCAPSRVGTSQPTGEGFCGGGFAQAAPKGEILCAVAGSHRPSYSRRLMRWGAGANAGVRQRQRQPIVPWARKADSPIAGSEGSCR